MNTLSPISFVSSHNCDCRITGRRAGHSGCNLHRYRCRCAYHWRRSIRRAATAACRHNRPARRIADGAAALRRIGRIQRIIAGVMNHLHEFHAAIGAIETISPGLTGFLPNFDDARQRMPATGSDIPAADDHCAAALMRGAQLLHAVSLFQQRLQGIARSHGLLSHDKLFFIRIAKKLIKRAELIPNRLYGSGVLARHLVQFVQIRPDLDIPAILQRLIHPPIPGAEAVVLILYRIRKIARSNVIAARAAANNHFAAIAIPPAGSAVSGLRPGDAPSCRASRPPSPPRFKSLSIARVALAVIVRPSCRASRPPSPPRFKSLSIARVALAVIVRPSCRASRPPSPPWFKSLSIARGRWP